MAKIKRMQYSRGGTPALDRIISAEERFKLDSEGSEGSSMGGAKERRIRQREEWGQGSEPGTSSACAKPQ